MRTDVLLDWIRRRTELEWVALAAGLAVFGYVGWDGALWDARYQLLLHLIGLGAVAGLVVLAARGRALPRTPIDLPVLLLLAAMAVATASAMNLGMSLRALASMVGFAAMLPVALLCVRERPTWVGVVTSVPLLLLSAGTLLLMLARRIDWVLVGAPGLPPLRLASEGTPFGSVAVPPFVIWPAWALAGLIEDARLRRVVQWGLVAVGVPLTVLSGSRSAWLAAGVTLVAAAVPWAWRRRHHLLPAGRPDARTIGLGVVGLVALAGVALVVAPRLTAVTSLLYRASLWRDTLVAWSSDPLLGIGPGFMPYARMAAAPDGTFPVRQPHSHNLPLGVLGDGGIVGLVAALLLIGAIAWFAGPWRARTLTGARAGFVLLGLGVGGLFEDLTFEPDFNLLAIGLLAVALTDAGAVTWRPISRPRLVALPAAAGAFVLVTAMVVADAGSIAYRAGVDAAARGDWSTAAERLERSVAIDPWHPAGPKALAVAADRAGLPDLARAAAEEAVARNPGDAPSWVNLAFACQDDGDRECQAHAAERAVATAGFFEPELLNAAWLFDDLGDTASADDAYLRSLLSQRLTIFDGPWPRDLEVDDATLAEDFGALLEFNRLLGRWAMGEPIEPEAIADPATRALAHALRGEREEADAWIERAIDAAPDSIVAWDLAVVLRDHWGRSVERELAIAGAVRGRAFPPRSAEARIPSQIFDIAAFRTYPADGFVSRAHRLGTNPPYPWVLQTILP